MKMTLHTLPPTTHPHKLNISNISAVTDPILMKLYRFLGKSRTDFNCHGNICPGKSSPGNICSNQEYLNCYCYQTLKARATQGHGRVKAGSTQGQGKANASSRSGQLDGKVKEMFRQGKSKVKERSREGWEARTRQDQSKVKAQQP